MADGEAAGQALGEVDAAESLAHVAHVALGVETLAVEAGDAAGLLAAMLQRVEAERGEARRLRRIEHPEHAALQAGGIVERVPVGRRPSLVSAHRDFSTRSSISRRCRAS